MEKNSQNEIIQKRNQRSSKSHDTPILQQFLTSEPSKGCVASKTLCDCLLSQKSSL